MAIIRTRKGEEIIVDDAKFEELNKFNWFLVKGYANMTIPNKYIKSDKRGHLPMHRYLTDCPKGLVVDHINCNKTDNRLENLEIVTREENIRRAHKNGLGSNGYHRKQALKYLKESQKTLA